MAMRLTSQDQIYGPQPRSSVDTVVRDEKHVLEKLSKEFIVENDDMVGQVQRMVARFYSPHARAVLEHRLFSAYIRRIKTPPLSKADATSYDWRITIYKWIVGYMAAFPNYATAGTYLQTNLPSGEARQRGLMISTEGLPGPFMQSGKVGSSSSLISCCESCGTLSISTAGL